MHRDPGGRRWETLFEYPGDRRSGLVPVKFSVDDPDPLYVISDQAGDTSGLIACRISTRSFTD
ncbi:MAG: hypothetical protein JJT85_02935 [Chromatiales bacterium]|nr:hypothetical protein [Chromatiales bacterium]